MHHFSFENKPFSYFTLLYYVPKQNAPCFFFLNFIFKSMFCAIYCTGCDHYTAQPVPQAAIHSLYAT